MRRYSDTKQYGAGEMCGLGDLRTQPGPVGRKAPGRLLEILLVVVLVLCLRSASTEPMPCPSQQAGQTLDGSSARGLMNSDRLQLILNNYSGVYYGVGLQATVLLPGGESWSVASGYADLRDHCAMTLQHHLYIGSMTKLYTATLIMRQVQEGALSLDDPVSRWIDLPDASHISVRMLLGHRSGLRDYAWDPWFDVRYIALPNKSWRSDELLAVIRHKRVLFEPGTQYAYSNSNYLLLGMILERLTGKPYGDLLRQLTAQELGLHDTYFASGPHSVLIASGYDESLLHLGRRNVSGLRTSTVSGAFAAGGVLSTSSDMARFTQALFEGKILNACTLTQMTAFVEGPDTGIAEQTGYGLGVRRLQVGGEELVGHTGTILGYSGTAFYSPQRGYTIVVLSNLSAIDHISLLQDIQELVIGELEY